MKSFYFLDATLYFYRIHNQNGTKVWKFNRVLDISKFYYYVFNEFPIYLEKKSGDFCRFISTFIIQGLPGDAQLGGYGRQITVAGI